MCGGVRFSTSQGEQQVYFPNPHACLPVRLRDGANLLLPWGRRRQQAGQLPPGGWARLESIYAGKWAAYAPRPVQILVSAYMEKDAAGISHWFDLDSCQFVQGLVAHYQQEQRIYVVTQATPPEYVHIHERWPRILAHVEKQETA